MARTGKVSSWIRTAALAMLALATPEVAAPTALAAPVSSPAEAPTPPTSKTTLRNVTGLYVPPGVSHTKRQPPFCGFAAFYPATGPRSRNRFARRSVVKAGLLGRGQFSDAFARSEAMASTGHYAPTRSRHAR